MKKTSKIYTLTIWNNCIRYTYVDILLWENRLIFEISKVYFNFLYTFFFPFKNISVFDLLIFILI